MNPTETPGRLVAQAPALAAATWIPEGKHDVLSELATEHRRLLAERGRLSEELFELEAQFEREVQEVRDEQASAIREAREATLPDPTPPARREALIAEKRQRLAAANDALDGFPKDATTCLEEEALTILRTVAADLDAAAEKRREAERLLAEARAKEIDVARVEMWVKRNAGRHDTFGRNPSLRFIAWDQLQTYTPDPEPEPGGMGGYRPQLSDPPSLPRWDRERVARAAAIDKPDRRAFRHTEED